MNNIDRVGGWTGVISLKPTLGTDAYTAADIMGGLIKLEGISRVANSPTGKGILHSVRVVDVEEQDVSMAITFFNAEPEDSTTVDDAALVVHANDFDKIIETVSITTYVEVGGVSVASASNIGIGFESAGPDLWMIVVTRGTPTHTANGLRFVVTILQD